MAAATSIAALFAAPSTPPPPSSNSSLSLSSTHRIPFTHPIRVSRIHHHIPLLRHFSISIARSAKATTLPTIPKTNAGFLLLIQELGLSIVEGEALMQKHPQLELIDPDSLRSRLASLESIGIVGFALRRTVVKCPEILTSPEIELLVDFVSKELRGLKPAKLDRLLALAQSQSFASFSKRITLLLDQEIPSEKLAHVINNVNLQKFFSDKRMDDIEEMIVYLRRFRWPDLVVRRPMLLNLDLHEQLIPRVEFLTNLGGGDEEAAAFLINKLPNILSYTVEHFRSHREFWRSVGLADDQVFKIALVYPNLFSISRERKLQPRIEFLKQCGFTADNIFKFLIKSPLFLSLSLEDNLSKKLVFLVKIGYKHRTRELVMAIGAATRTSCENMQMVVGLFFSYGFSCEEVLAMSKKHPQVLQYNHESLEKKMKFLIGVMGREVGELLAFPAFLGYNLDDRIKLRYAVEKETRGKEMSLNKLLSVSSKKFYSNKSTKDEES